jgi:hypothetical protein
MPLSRCVIICVDSFRLGIQPHAPRHPRIKEIPPHLDPASHYPAQFHLSPRLHLCFDCGWHARAIWKPDGELMALRGVRREPL